MGVPTSEVGYTFATTGRRDHKVHKGHVVKKPIDITDESVDNEHPSHEITQTRITLRVFTVAGFFNIEV
jgi:hypothetical protein